MAVTLPPPRWPGLGPYFPSDWTVTICTIVPVMFGPFLITESVTTIGMLAGIVSGGGGLLPGRVLHTPPQTLSLTWAKPANSPTPGVTVPLITLFFHHCDPQKFTVSPIACGSTSPMTNARPRVCEVS